MGLIGNDPNQVSLNGMLGDLAFQSKDGAVIEKISSTSGLKITTPADGTKTALTITHTGSGNALVVEDTANPDSTPFLIDGNGNIIQGSTVGYAGAFGDFANSYIIGTNQIPRAFLQEYSNDIYAPLYEFSKSRGTTAGAKTIVQTNDQLGSIRFSGADGTNIVASALIHAYVDATPGTNSMPGRLIFSTTASGASAPTERMRIDSNGNVGIGGGPSSGVNLDIQKATTGTANAFSISARINPDSTVSVMAIGVGTYAISQASSTTPSIRHFYANQGAFSGSHLNQYGFLAESTLTGATNNYGFYSSIAAGAGRWSFYAGTGTAANYFAGDMQLGKTVTAAGTTGAQTINKTIGSVNFAAGATSLVVTNNLVTTNSIITATVGSNDSTMKSVTVIAGSGSFTLYANAAATAETRVNFHVFN